MFLMQRYSQWLRPGKAEDGPPYPLPGMWDTFGAHDTLAEAVAGMGRVFFPLGDGISRQRDNYRIVKVAIDGRKLGVYDSYGNPELVLVAA